VVARHAPDPGWTASRRPVRSGERLRPTKAPPRTVLLAGEPDPAQCVALVEALEGRGVGVVRRADGAELLFAAGELAPAIVVVTAHLPTVPLADAVRVIRGRLEIPVFVAIGGGEADLAQEGLAAGATGVLSRPYVRREVETVLGDHIARARSLVERSAVIRLGPLHLDSLSFRVTAAGRDLDLTVREFELLRFLMLHVDLAVTVDDLRQGVWGARGDSVSGNTIAVHIGRLRADLAGVAAIVNIRGFGYRFSLLA